jgi:hypothetical protein
VVPRESIFRLEAEAHVAGTAAEATKAHSGDVKTHIHPGCLERDRYQTRATTREKLGLKMPKSFFILKKKQ